MRIDPGSVKGEEMCNIFLHIKGHPTGKLTFRHLSCWGYNGAFIVAHPSGCTGYIIMYSLLVSVANQ